MYLDHMQCVFTGEVELEWVSSLPITRRDWAGATREGVEQDLPEDTGMGKERAETVGKAPVAARQIQGKTKWRYVYIAAIW